MPRLISDSDTAALESLCRSAVEAGVGAALLEAHRLLLVSGETAAADLLLQHWDALTRVAVSRWDTHRVIDRARA